MAMRNPALVVLYVLTGGLTLGGLAVGIVAAVTYENYNPVIHAHAMAEMLDVPFESFSLADLAATASADLGRNTGIAVAMLAAGIVIGITTLAVTAIGRAQKNAMQELAEKLIAQQQEPPQPAA